MCAKPKTYRERVREKEAKNWAEKGYCAFCGHEAPNPHCNACFWLWH